MTTITFMTKELFIIETEESWYKINHKCLLYILKFHARKS